ncbi:uncharacterized protein EAF01_011373 [Botrytis porri]|uniref:uncharacterized protein n=1 Tax=Botrytis porri TaxID=87229 RepID=UPI001900EFFA|nr:uncharacterized protein EAF01_011373 [Botrytis porri]KAF7885308.1 hypothetical protein EAF01_011373 [Botrytis porri]
MDQFSVTADSARIDFLRVIENRQVLLQQILGQVVATSGLTQEMTSNFLNLYKNFEGLLLATPAPGLVYRYGERVARVTFHSLQTVGKNYSGHICVNHLWKGDGGFVLVEDVFLFGRPSEIFRYDSNESPPVRRRTTLLNNDKKKLFSQPMIYEIISHADRLMMGTLSGLLLPQDRICFYIERLGLIESLADEVNCLLPEEQQADVEDHANEDAINISNGDPMLRPRIIYTLTTSLGAEADDFTIHAEDHSGQDDSGEDEHYNGDSEDGDAQDAETERYKHKLQGQEEWIARDTNHAIYLVATLRTRLDNVAARERDVEDREAILKTDTAALERQKIDQENILAARAAAIEKQKLDQETALATRAITLTDVEWIARMLLRPVPEILKDLKLILVLS